MNPLLSLSNRECRALIPSSTDYLKVEKEKCSIKTVAEVVQWVTTGEDTYIMYSFNAINNADEEESLLFAWITPYDERHRSWGNHRRQWYDELQPGYKFDVQYNPNEITNHIVIPTFLSSINNGILFIKKA